jgi:hypothetical protein
MSSKLYNKTRKLSTTPADQQPIAQLLKKKTLVKYKLNKGYFVETAGIEKTSFVSEKVVNFNAINYI